MGTTEDKLNAILSSKEDIRMAIVDKGVDCDISVPLADYAGKISDISGGGGTVPVVPPPTGSFFAAIAYFTGENGDYDNYAYAYTNNSSELNSQFLHSTVFASFTLHSTPGGSDSVIVPNSKMFGFYFGNQFNLTSIGSSFLANCYSFNQPLTIPSSVTSIGTNFLATCYSFNQPLTIPSSVTSIGNFFIPSCYSFNQPLTIPSSVTSIGTNFIISCYSFNQPLTIPSSVTSIGSGFLSNCYSFNRLITNTSVSPTDNNSLGTQQVNTELYQFGLTLTGSGAATWKANLPDRTSSPYRKLILG